MPCAYLTDGPLVVAVDSSTQSTKAIIVDGAGVLAMAAIEAHAPTHPPAPTSPPAPKPWPNSAKP